MIISELIPTYQLPRAYNWRFQVNGVVGGK